MNISKRCNECMISVSEAIQLLQSICKPLPPLKMELSAAHQHTLAEDVFSPIDMPTFAQSAMDGYAFCFEGWQKGEKMPIVATIVAGETQTFILQKHQAMRIFTGAPIPQGADTVVMQEKTVADKEGLLILDEALQKGANVRPAASQTAKGDLVVAKNTLLTAGSIGLLASVGVAEVWAYPRPRVGLLVTGKELAALGTPLQYGQVYESNAYTLKAALAEIGIVLEQKKWVDDDLAATQTAIAAVWEKVDILLITGGISVGDYDFVQPALEQLGTKKLFYKVAQKPAKPFYVGTLAEKIVFALPGNPASVHTCFYRYVKPFLLQMMGHTDSFSPTTFLSLAHDYQKKGTLTLFLKAKRLPNQQVEILSHQESYKMNSYVQANGLVMIAAERNQVLTGEQVPFFAF